MCGAELHPIRGVAEVLAMPWHAFNAESGAWTLHPADLRALDPVVLIDHFVMPTPTFPPHPHAGFSAVTYLFDDSEGGFINRDSLGHRNPIGPGSLHWTQAGRGLLHEEVPATPGRAAQGLQLFVNSRGLHKHTDPAVFHLASSDVPVVQVEGGASVRVVLGSFGGVEVMLGAHTPITLLDIRLPAGSSLAVPVGASMQSFALVRNGSLVTPGGIVAAHHAVRHRREAGAVHLQAGDEPTQVVLIAGEPLGEPVVPRGPFIASSGAEAAEMMARFRRGEMGSLSPSPD